MKIILLASLIALSGCITERTVLDDHTGEEIIVLGNPTTGEIPIPTPRPYIGFTQQSYVDFEEGVYNDEV